MRRVSPLLFRQHLSPRLPQACTHEVGRSIRNHTNSSSRNHRFNMARYRFYTRAKTLALRPLGVRVLIVVEGLSSAFSVSKERRPAAALPLSLILFFMLARYISSDYRWIIGIISLSPPLPPTFFMASLSFRSSNLPPNVHFGSTPVIIAVTFAIPL